MNELADLLRFVPVSEAAKERVVQRLHEAHRRYHNLDHVVEMWHWHQEFKAAQFGPSDDEIVASFCLYHDVVYNPQAFGDGNEQASADLWLADSADTASFPIRIAVDEAIIASADHFRYRDIPHDPVYSWCLDLDLLRLGSDGFTAHGRAIRAEFAHLTDAQWIKSSSYFRAKVMAQSRIFFHAQFETMELRARQNLARALMQDWQQLGYVE